MANLASMYRNQGRWKEAEKLEVRVMETRVRVLSEEHPDTLTSIWPILPSRGKGKLGMRTPLNLQRSVFNQGHGLSVPAIFTHTHYQTY